MRARHPGQARDPAPPPRPRGLRAHGRRPRAHPRLHRGRDARPVDRPDLRRPERGRGVRLSCEVARVHARTTTTERPAGERARSTLVRSSSLPGSPASGRTDGSTPHRSYALPVDNRRTIRRISRPRLGGLPGLNPCRYPTSSGCNSAQSTPLKPPRGARSQPRAAPWAWGGDRAAARARGDPCVSAPGAVCGSRSRSRSQPFLLSPPHAVNPG